MFASKKPVAKKRELTVPDLVLLSLLAEQPMHGYQANLELERRQVQDWAGISRPQVYYSLEKLARLGLVADAGDPEPALGPERRIFSTTAKGRGGPGRGAGARRLDYAARPPALPHLDGPFLAGGARRVPETNPAAAEIPEDRTGARSGNTARGRKRSRPWLS